MVDTPPSVVKNEARPYSSRKGEKLTPLGDDVEVLKVDPIQFLGGDESSKKKRKRKEKSSVPAKEKNNAPSASLALKQTIEVKLKTTEDIRMPFYIKPNRIGVHKEASRIEGLW